MSARDAGEERRDATLHGRSQVLAEVSRGPVPEPFGTWSEGLATRLMRRPSVRLAIVVLVLLYGAAIAAPLLANDRPYLLEAVDVEAFEKARRSLNGVALQVRGLLEEGEASYLQRRTQGSSQSYAEAVAAERRAAATRLDTLARYLPASEVDACAQLRVLFEGASSKGAGELGRDWPRRVREATKAWASAALRGDDPPDVRQEGVVLRSHRSWPLFASLNGLEVGLFVLWLAVVRWLLGAWWQGRQALAGEASPHGTGRRRGTRVLRVLFVALAFGSAQQLLVHDPSPFHTSRFKQGLDAGTLVAQRAVFPPLAYGYAETHPAEAWRPPTWRANSEISAEGRYLRGSRRATPDPVTGFLAEPRPVEVRFAEPPRNAPTRHLFGTDALGRDLFVRALHGARVSLSVGLVSTLLLVLLGVAIGVLAGAAPGRLDAALSRLIEVVLCFPVFFLVLVVVAFVGPSLVTLMVVIGLVRWTGVARLVRAEFLRLRELDFVLAARAQGLSAARILVVHMLPNALAPVLVAATFALAAGLLIESGLSFLGFGVQAPVPSWGALVSASRDTSYWWVQLFPGALIFVTVLCTNLVGDALRDALDPRDRA